MSQAIHQKQLDMALDLSLMAFSSEDSALKVNSVSEEYKLVEQHALTNFGIRDAFPLKQKLTVRGEKTFDTLYLDLPDGSVREYWFDISEFFGR